MKNVSRTVEQKTNLLGFPKPGEIIEMTGAHMLEASDRAIFNVLYQMAHDSGELLDPAAEWEIPSRRSGKRSPNTRATRGYAIVWSVCGL